MKITRENYEIWFLDYLEGNLDPQTMNDVRLFMVQNADLAEEFEALSPVLRQDSAVQFPEKDSLKRESFDDPEYFETAAIASMEGDLPEDERAQFENWLLKNPAKQRFLNELSATKSKPDLRIRFSGKDGLKRRNFRVILLTGIVPVAAAVVMAFLIFYPQKRMEPIKNLTSEIATPKGGGSSPAVAAVPTSATPGKVEPNLPVARLVSVKTTRKKILNDQINRQFDAVAALQPRFAAVTSSAPVFIDLALAPVSDPVFNVPTRVPLSEFFKNRLLALKANSPKRFLTREEVTIAGLRLFTRLPGNRLTGKKGQDGRLQSISFDTKLLAISIPVNQ